MRVANSQSGLGIVEIIVVIAVLITVFAGILQLASLESQVQTRAREESKAYILARESMEAARFVRDADWSLFAGLSLETNYYPVISGGSWTLSTTDPGPIDEFSRRVILHEVVRDGEGNIAASGTPDDETKRVEVIVEWAGQGGAVRSVTLEAYMTNWQGHL